MFTSTAVNSQFNVISGEGDVEYVVVGGGGGGGNVRTNNNWGAGGGGAGGYRTGIINVHTPVSMSVGVGQGGAAQNGIDLRG